jgi:hypothetical protein
MLTDSATRERFFQYLVAKNPRTSEITTNYVSTQWREFVAGR